MPEPIAMVCTTHALHRFKNRFPEMIPEDVPTSELGQWVAKVATHAMEGPAIFGSNGVMTCKHMGIRFVIQMVKGRPHLLTVMPGHFGGRESAGRRPRRVHVPRHEREEDF